MEQGGAADNAGLQAGDIITKIDDTDISELGDITAALRSYTAGDTVTIEYYRNNEEHTTQLTFDSVPQDNLAATQESSQDNSGSSGGYTDPYSDPWNFFNYFFGNGGRYSGSAA